MCRSIEAPEPTGLSLRRPLTRRGFTCLALPALALPWLPRAAMAAPVEPAAAEPLGMEEIAAGVFVHRGAIDLMRPDNAGAIANLGFIVGEEAAAVVDSGGSLNEGRRLLAAVKAATDRPVRYVVNTHMHPDHLFGNAAFAGEGITFVGHRNLAAALAARRETYLASNLEAMGAALMEGTELVPPTLAIAETTKLDLGGRAIELRPWPTAHTNNDVTVADSATGALFAGDLVFQEHCPTLDGSLKGWLAVLDELQALKPATLVPGHGPTRLSTPSAFADTRRYLEVLARDLRAAIADGVPMMQAASTAAASEAGRWQLFEEYNPRNATAAFAELEWE
ncbi:quinoprotein relay system zinc metallohydrolase 2 [Mangrovicella endophytica]|uniref:quinoprotein relay system zinc metallohydrolase 2 n=1 Tax=Mangrovicella endophytica TaxID=2066697 RepID=UPI0018E42FDD|nr:quinoprotein relay system zinc metallohydrolase 2 [Mangrovicella endophytica]